MVFYTVHVRESTWSIYYWLNRICSDTLYIVYFFPKHRKVQILHFLGYKTLTLSYHESMKGSENFRKSAEKSAFCITGNVGFELFDVWINNKLSVY